MVVRLASKPAIFRAWDGFRRREFRSPAARAFANRPHWIHQRICSESSAHGIESLRPSAGLTEPSRNAASTARAASLTQPLHGPLVTLTDRHRTDVSDEVARFNAELGDESAPLSSSRAGVSAPCQIAVARVQFETKHAFTDGNGRTGRALIQAMLRSRRLTRQVSVPVSTGLPTKPLLPPRKRPFEAPLLAIADSSQISG